MKLLAGLLLSVCASAQVVPAPIALPNHIVFLEAVYDSANHPNGSVTFGAGQSMSATDYLTNMTDFMGSSLRGITVANRTGVQHIVFRSSDGKAFLFLSADGGVAAAGQSTAFSWSSGGGVGTLLASIKVAPTYLFFHVRFINSPVSADAKAIVASIGLTWGLQ